MNAKVCRVPHCSGRTVTILFVTFTKFRGPVMTSTVLGSSSILLFACMLFVFYLAAKKTRDEILVIAGSLFWVIGGTLLYFLWSAGAKTWEFVLPVIVCICGFPFIASSNRSLFTRRVDANPTLETRHAFMQALLSMAASVAGFVTPGFVATYVLRTPEEVETSAFHRELNPVALYVVIGPLLTILGVIYVSATKPLPIVAAVDEVEEELAPDETSKLVSDPARRRRSSAIILEQKVDPATEANRRNSAMCMGIPQYDNPLEGQRRASVFAQIASECPLE